MPKYFNTIKSEFREIETIQHAQLDQYLEEFLVGIRKETKEGECNGYHPGTLDGYQTMTNRYLKQQKYPYDILLPEEFQQSPDCLKAKKKHLKELGVGNKPNIAEEVDFSNEKALIESGAMSTDNAEGLVTLVWYLNTLNFSLERYS